MTIVDIHCHTFNADDLPVKGFVKLVAGQRLWLARALAKALDRVIQGMASGAEEIARLDRLLAAPRDITGVPHGADERPLAAAEEEAEALLEQLYREDPQLAQAADFEASIDNVVGPPEPTAGSGARLPGNDLRRYLRWVALFGKDRLDLTRAMTTLYSEVDLFTPMLVDFQDLEDRPQTTTLEQLELQEKISRLTLLGRLTAHVVPFVGFDPRRPGALGIVEEAVTNFGCVGVKMYPPMGFLPWRNRQMSIPGMSSEEALDVDRALSDLYDLCTGSDLPITAHGNPTQFARPEFKDFSGPDRWAVVLEDWPGLRLNLGHFGWSGLPDGWPQKIARLTQRYPNLYADIGNHELQDLDGTMASLDRIFSDAPVMQDRFMFGSDWYMVASHNDFESFLIRIRNTYAARYPEQLDRFMGGAALSFLGFDDPHNSNNRRTRARCERHGVPPPSWLTT